MEGFDRGSCRKGGGFSDTSELKPVVFCPLVVLPCTNLLDQYIKNEDGPICLFAQGFTGDCFVLHKFCHIL